MHSIGIDIGYSTIKFVAINEKRQQVYKSYTFHKGKVDSVLVTELKNIINELKITQCKIALVGEHHLKKSISFIDNVSATIKGALFAYPNINTIFNIGAQKSYYISGFNQVNKNIKFSMNASCSAGTGSFLEEQVSRLDIELNEFADIANKAQNPVNIAGRCSVFSKTDMIHHQQEGADISDILMGLAYALVKNFKANVVQRNPVNEPVLFVGGVAKNKAVVNAIKKVFRLSDTELIVTPNCTMVTALGVALYAKEQIDTFAIEDIIKILEHSAVLSNSSSNLTPLKKFGINDTINKHEIVQVKKPYNFYLGIDIGSTSTNLVLVNNKKEVVAFRYLRTKGNPKKAVNKGLNSLKEQFNNELKILGVGTTGSGRKYIGNYLNADIIVNEITAQAKGSCDFYKDVDTIFEIGGQDSKYISLQNGQVIDFEMNKICAAGTGSFIEEQAKKLNVKIEDYAQVALNGQSPADLGDRCTVFIEGNISKAVAKGLNIEDITAGLSYSIVNNYLNRVVGSKKIGEKILLQGGIAHNQAVVNAFRAVLNKPVIVPNYFSITGALGVALLCKEAKENNVNSYKANEITNIDSEINKLYLKGYCDEIDSAKKTVGIPRVLFMHKLFPMFNVFFTQLGFNVVLSDETNAEIIALSQQNSLDETCYPVKLINGHVATLIDQKVDYIFLPSLYTMKHEVSKTRQDYACVYMQTAPHIVDNVMGLTEKGIKLLSPALSFKFGKKYMMKTLLNLGAELGKNKVQTTLALTKGMKRLKQFEKEVEKLGKEVIDNLNKNEKAFVVITRAYGIADKTLNMQISKKLRAMGYQVLTLGNLPAHSYDLSADYPNMYWPFGQHILSGAKIVKQHKNLYAIYLTNHGCGPDTMVKHYFDYEMKGKPYLHIEVDEHSSNVGVLTRLEAFMQSLRNSKQATQNESYLCKFGDFNDNKPILIPHLYPYSQLLQAYLKQKGYVVKVMSPTTKESLKLGKKYLSGKEYVSLVALVGDILTEIKDKNQSANIFIPKTEGSETYGQYSRLVKQKLSQHNFSKVNVISPFLEDTLVNPLFAVNLINLLLLGDLIMMCNKENQQKLIGDILTDLKDNKLNQELLINTAKKVYQNLKSYPEQKSILILGETSVVFNDILNNGQITKLSHKYQLYYTPLSEQLLFRLIDFIKQQKLTKQEALLKIALENMELVSLQLAEFSHFDSNLIDMYNESTKILKMYAGGNGKYRLMKQLRNSNVNGIIVLSSMYENTGTIIKLLKSKYNHRLKTPVLELFFDGSEHSSNQQRLTSFINISL